MNDKQRSIFQVDYSTNMMITIMCTNRVAVPELLTQWSDRMAHNKPRDSRTTSMLHEVVGRQQQHHDYVTSKNQT